MPVNPLPRPSPLIFFIFWVVIVNYVVTKITRPSPLRIFFFLVPSAYRVHAVYLVFYVFMAAISKWYLIFMDFYGKKQGMCILLLQKCCSALALGGRQSRIAAEAVFVLKFAQFQSAGFSRRFSHPASK